MTAKIIQFPEPVQQVSNLAALLRAIEEPWIRHLHVPAIARRVSGMRLAVHTLSDLVGVSPNEISTEWLLRKSASDLKTLSHKVAPMFRRQFVAGVELLIKHIRFGVARKSDCPDERKGSVVSLAPGTFKGKV